MRHTLDITIIGGGIIGLLTAKELVQAGCSVTVIDQSLIGKESSWAGGGILLPLYPWRQAPAITTLALASIKNYPALAQELHSSTGIDPQWSDCGMLVCQNPDLATATQWCTQHGIPYQQAAQALFNALNTDPVSPLWLPTVAQIRSPRLLKALTAFLRAQGVQFIEQCTISGCQLKHNTVEALLTERGKFAVNQLVISAGAWTGQLIKQLFGDQQAPKITPIKGQMLLFDAPPNTLTHIILAGEYYLIPRRDGKILVGSSVEHSQFDKSTSRTIKNRLHTFATQLVPDLTNYPLINHWAGLRPGTHQGIPYIAKHPELTNLSINAGHFRNGLVMAPASAKLITDLILAKPPSVAPEPYQLHPNLDSNPTA